MMANKKVLDICRGKDVLHLGALGDHQRYLNDLEDWDFIQLKKCAKRIIGLDIDRKGVALLRKAGYSEIQYGNAENFELNHKFDVIFAGDLIEHLNNTGNFLVCCRDHMTPNSTLLIATPNPYAINILLRAIFFDVSKAIFKDHTSLLNEDNVKLSLYRYKFLVKDVTYYTILPNAALQHLKGLAIVLFSVFKKKFNQSFIVGG